MIEEITETEKLATSSRLNLYPAALRDRLLEDSSEVAAMSTRLQVLWSWYLGPRKIQSDPSQNGSYLGPKSRRDPLQQRLLSSIIKLDKLGPFRNGFPAPRSMGFLSRCLKT